MATENTPASDTTTQSSNARIGNNVRAGLSLLQQASMYAEDTGVDLWDFALRTRRLFDAGLTISDLRWLVAKGFAEHGLETSNYGASQRSFRRMDGLNFESTSCLVLTRQGVALANAVANDFESMIDGTNAVLRIEPVLKPRWIPERRELWLGDTIVKRFRVPARNQEMILSAFEEDDWPQHIDDPLPGDCDIDPQSRLHDAIYRLNHKQLNGLLRFRGNGNADGVLWEIIRPDTSGRLANEYANRSH